MRLAALVVAVCACDSGKPAQPAADHLLHRTDTPDSVSIVGTGVSLADQPMVGWVGLPMSGNVDVAIDLKSTSDLRKAHGSIKITCAAGCRLGDDKAMLKPSSKRAQAFAGDGLYVGHLDFDHVDIGLTVADGKATITTWDVTSKDIELALSGTVELGRTLADSKVDACLRFKDTPALQARDPKTSALIQTTGAERAADGMFNIQLQGTVGQLRRLSRVCDGSRVEPATVDDTTSGDIPTPPLDNDVTPAAAAAIAAAITRKTDTAYEIDTAKWAALLADPVAIGKGTRVVPAIKDGNPDGFKLYAIKPESLAAHLGFVNGDTIHTIAGTPLTMADKALEIYTAVRDLKKGSSVVVTLSRRGKPLTITYTLR